MFGDKKAVKSSVSPTAIECLIGERMSIVGDVTFAGGLQIEGKLKGTLRADDSNDAFVKLNDRGRVEGEIHAPQAEIHGELIGDVVADRLQLGSSARVRGNVFYRVLEMAAGAQVNGQMVHQDEPQKQLPKPDPSN